MNNPTFTVDFWGDLACFTMPETNVERWSYPCPTPSAARGMLDAIFWDGPQFRWEVLKIEILKPLRRIPIRRNEVKGRIPVQEVHGWMLGGEPKPLMADFDSKDDPAAEFTGRTQRQTIALADVRYRVTAAIKPRPGFEDRIVSYKERFRRRIEAGKCIQQPYLGQREFAAYFSWPDPEYQPIAHDQDVGFMHFDSFDLDAPEGTPRMSVFRAAVRAGVMEVPPYSDPAVLKSS